MRFLKHKEHQIEVFVRRDKGRSRPYGLITPPPLPDGNRSFVRLFDLCQNYPTIKAAYREGQAFAINAIENGL